MDCSPSSSSVHGILQARILEWVAISFSRESSWPRDQTQVSLIVDKRFTIWASDMIRCVKFREINLFQHGEGKQGGVGWAKQGTERSFVAPAVIQYKDAFPL